MIQFNKGKILVENSKLMMTIDYGTLCNSISTRNPQVKSIVGRVHQTIGNMIRTFKIQEIDFKDNKPWKGILLSTMFVLQHILHTTIKYVPLQRLFGRDLSPNFI